MATIEQLMDVIGKPVESEEVRSLVAADALEASNESHTDGGGPRRCYLSGRSAGYKVMHCLGRVDTVWVHVLPSEGIEAFTGPLPGGLTVNDDREEVLRRFGEPSRSGAAHRLGRLRFGPWDRFDGPRVCVHFEYDETDERIRGVTLMNAESVP